ncbi:MAG TPA: ABC transporter substrate-binding protein, partial [Solirubrobacteraceae bacterium]|nr:ABC transporter substrate-binding protein [Solirubrobacteraceae bacterium]
MPGRPVRVCVVALALLAAMIPAVGVGCGWGAAEPERPNVPSPQRGGTLRVLGVRVPAAIDPHRVSGPSQAMVHAAVHRTVLTYPPGEQEAVGDLAEGPPQVSEDGRAVTVTLRGDGRFGPHGDPIVARDVEHGIERALADPVAGPAARRLLGDLVGLPAQLGRWRDVPGVEAPDEGTLVLRLRRPAAGLAIAGLATSASTPIPGSTPRARPLKADEIAYSGPYLPEARLEAADRAEAADDGSGTSDATGPALEEEVGGQPPIPDDAVILVRNPSWGGGGPRPAYVERVAIEPAGARAAGERVLDGSRALWAGPEIPAATLRRAARRGTRQLVRVSAPVTRFVALNAARAPFDDVLVRRAALAVLDRRALWRASGGGGEPASHWLPPGVPGHDRSGGAEGLGMAWLREPGADRRQAADLLRAAGLRQGRYEGEPLPAVAVDAPPERALAEEAATQLERAGFELELEFVPQGEMAARCLAPGTEVAVCPNAALATLSGEPGAILASGFDGDSGGPGAQHWSHLDEPAVDLAIANALDAPEDGQAEAWANVNRAVAFQAPGAPWRWDERPLLRARDVRGEVDERQGTWALAWTWLGE